MILHPDPLAEGKNKYKNMIFTMQNYYNGHEPLYLAVYDPDTFKRVRRVEMEIEHDKEMGMKMNSRRPAVDANYVYLASKHGSIQNITVYKHGSGKPVCQLEELDAFPVDNMAINHRTSSLVVCGDNGLIEWMYCDEDAEEVGLEAFEHVV